eukprot:CAMPEP_0170392598 /NCGR_PEP_ID=MMETSP0117_2-20130122/20276_1 /TAXON_ID=400756 /ORGANISM="Durinskia baltica, Strain CSIRO CS-38" /LENGTH=118 /DNA_ID=CAMNT_0010648743 /DNA_START=122 /DNA_END=475 /DNA_ORIENTATION=+
MKRRKQKQCKAAVASFLFSAPTNCPLLLQDWLRQIAVDVLRLAAAAVGIGQLDSIKNSLEVFAHVAPVVNDLVFLKISCCRFLNNSFFGMSDCTGLGICACPEAAKFVEIAAAATAAA